MSRRGRIEELQNELRARGAAFMVDDGFDEGMTEAFLEHVLRIESAECKTVRDWLAESGYVPRDAPDDQMAAELTALLDHLSLLGIAVESGDHLSDRELYEWIAEHLDAHLVLPDDTLIHLDVLGSGSDEDNRNWLRYYATEHDRAHWRAEFPGDELPPREKPLHDRSRAVRRPVDAS